MEFFNNRICSDAVMGQLWMLSHVIIVITNQSCPWSFFLDLTRPGETLTRPDPRLLTKSLTRPDPPTHSLHMYYVSWVQYSSCQQGTIIQLLHEFEKNSGHFFSSGLVLFPEGGKRISSGLIFQDHGLETTKRLHISDVSKVHSRINLSRSKLWNSNSFYPAKFSRPARVPKFQTGIICSNRRKVSIKLG